MPSPFDTIEQLIVSKLLEYLQSLKVIHSAT